MVSWKLAGGLFSRTMTSVVIEKELPIFINGEHLVTASIAPGMEREFVTGYLFGQGFINALEDLASIEIEDKTVKVTLKDAGKAPLSIAKANYRIVSGGGRAAYSNETSLPEIHNSMKIDKKAIFRAMNTLFEKAVMYRETEGVHAAGLFTAEAGPVCIVEDIGRHNTLDKAIGYGLLNNIDFGNTFLVSTGRMASEMVTKICRAGIPVAATKTAVTDNGLEIGRKCGLTIIGFVRDTGTRINTDMEVRVIKEAGMKIYTRAERILCE
ncbi:MAG TPA: formate dehydrogenase accessory sulfurtransferase FdhD [Dehalococcoidales bacterium]|nr:formate dehydrogenase accessory sulfurtransferase FdhD [Dehalococcoidales bacterium]